MTAATAATMVKKFTAKYGVVVTWNEPGEETNSRGVTVFAPSLVTRSAKVLLLKEKFSVLKSMQAAIGLTQDYTRYVLTLPCVEIKKDLVITDNHGAKWKVGVVDWFDIGGKAVAKQASLTEVV